MIIDRCPDVLGHFAEIAQQLLYVEFLQRRFILQRRIEITYIGLMMLGVMYLHGFRINIWFQRIICIGKFW